MSEEQIENENPQKTGFFQKPFFIAAGAKLSIIGQKLKLSELYARLPTVDFNDKKNLIILVLSIFLCVFSLAYFVFSGDSPPEFKDDTSSESVASGALPKVAKVKAESYIGLLPDKDVKEREFMATVKGEEKGSSEVLRFSLSLGLEKKILEEDVRQKMAPLMSETLRFLSQKTRAEIIEMIQEERTEELVRGLNDVLLREGIDLVGKGRVVSVSFTTYFFVSL